MNKFKQINMLHAFLENIINIVHLRFSSVAPLKLFYHPCDYGCAGRQSVGEGPSLSSRHNVNNNTVTDKMLVARYFR